MTCGRRIQRPLGVCFGSKIYLRKEIQKEERCEARQKVLRKKSYREEKGVEYGARMSLGNKENLRVCERESELNCER